MHKEQNEWILLSWEVKRYPTFTVGKLNQRITIIKSTNGTCEHWHCISNVMFGKDSRNRMNHLSRLFKTNVLDSDQQFPSIDISSLRNVQNFLRRIPMPRCWLQPVSPLSRINQTKAKQIKHTERALHPAFDINTTSLTYPDFFFQTRSQLLKSGLNSSKVWKIMSCTGNDSHQEEGYFVISQLSDQLWV